MVMKHTILIKVTHKNEFICSLPFKTTINFTEAVNHLVIRTAQQIEAQMVHPSEKFCQDLLVKFYFIRDFNFLMSELKRRTILVCCGVCGSAKDGNLKLCHQLLRKPAAGAFVFK